MNTLEQAQRSRQWHGAALVIHEIGGALRAIAAFTATLEAAQRRLSFEERLHCMGRVRYR